MPDVAVPHKACWRIVLWVLAGVAIALASVLGLHFANVIRLPFLPTASEIAFGMAVDRVVKDGSFDASVDVEAEIAIVAEETLFLGPINLIANVAARGSVSDFSYHDPYSFKVSDGAAHLNIALADAGGNDVFSPIEAAATFEADLAKETLDYTLESPVSLSNTAEISVDALKNGRQNAFEFKERDVEGKEATFRVDGESIMNSEAFGEIERIALESGFVQRLSVDDTDITLRVDEESDAISVSARVPIKVKVKGISELLRGLGSEGASTLPDLLGGSADSR